MSTKDALAAKLSPVIAQLVDTIVETAQDLARERVLSMLDELTAQIRNGLPKPNGTTPRLLSAPALGRNHLEEFTREEFFSHARQPVCSKCKQPGHNARSCGREPKGHRKRQSGSSDDDKPSSAKPIIELSLTDSREFCEVHGWVGRRAFQVERHDLCEPPVEINGHDEDGGEDDDGSHPDTNMWELGAGVRRRRRRNRHRLRKRTIQVKKITRAALIHGALEVTQQDFAEVEALRPKTWEKCHGGIRPCPFVSCRHNLYLDVQPETGSITINRPELEPWEIPPDQSCSLEIAERGGMTLEEVGEMLNLTRERARQLEINGLVKLRANGAIIRLK